MSAPGSKADLTAPKSNFRFTPQSGLRADIAPCPFRAKPGSRRTSLDPFVGAGEQGRWDVYPPRGASATTTSTGVGSKPAAGLCCWGQFDMTTMTGISAFSTT
jgi:hypothetical protein